jgi:NAD(P)H-dependent FMN reductase
VFKRLGWAALRHPQLKALPARGAALELTVRVCLLSAPVAQAADLLEADGYIFGTPENLAAMAGLMKDFFDRTYYPALDQISARPYATLICAGSDGHNAARQVERIATGWRLKAMAEVLSSWHRSAPMAGFRA